MVTGLDCHFHFVKMYGCHQFLNWWPQMPTGHLQLNGFESGTDANKKEEALANVTKLMTLPCGAKIKRMSASVTGCTFSVKSA